MQFFVITPIIKDDMFTGHYFTCRDRCYDGKGGVTALLRDFRSWFNPAISRQRYSQTYYDTFFDNGIVRYLDILKPQNGYHDVSFREWLDKGPGYKRAAELEKQQQ